MSDKRGAVEIAQEHIILQQQEYIKQLETMCSNILNDYKLLWDATRSRP